MLRVNEATFSTLHSTVLNNNYFCRYKQLEFLMHLSLRRTQPNPSKEIFTVGILVFFLKI